MRHVAFLVRSAAALCAAFTFQLWSPALAEPLAHERVFADIELADAMVSSVTGGAQGIPKMDQFTAAAIAADVATGNYASAFGRVRDYVISKGVAATLGNTASGFMAAVSAGEALGVRAQEHFGRGRLNALYTNLSRDTNAAGWPASYDEALRDDFLGQRIDAAILPVAHWLRRRSGQTGSDRHFAEMAYGMMIARRDFELGCERYGLTGGDCTPERLADEEAWHLETIARTHAVEHRVNLRLLEIARLAREEAEANRARELAERALMEAEALEAALAREAALAADRAEEEAQAAAERAEAARAALAALQAQNELAPPPALPASAVSTAVLDTETGENRTLYRVRLTNTSSQPIFGLGVDARMRTPAPDAGVVMTVGGELITLQPGASVEVSVLGDGALDAVRLYVTGAGQLLGAFDYPMLHESAALDEEAAGDEWISVPAVYRGFATRSWDVSMADQRLPDRQNLSTTASWEIILSIGEVDRDDTIFNSMIITKQSTRYSYTILGEFITNPNSSEREIAHVFRLDSSTWPDSTSRIILPIENGRIHVSHIRDFIESPFVRSLPGYALNRGSFNSNIIDYSNTVTNDSITTRGGTIYSKTEIYSVILHREQR